MGLLLPLLLTLLCHSGHEVLGQVVVSPFMPAISPFLDFPPLPALSSSLLTFSWWMPFQGMEWLDREYEAVTDPSSPRYLDFHTSEFIAAQVNPSQTEVAAPVLAFLTAGAIPSSNITQVNAELRVTTQVAVLEALFNVTFQQYWATNATTNGSSQGDFLLRTNQSILIPASVSPFLALLQGLNDLPVQSYQRLPAKPFLSRSPPQTSRPSSSSSSPHSFSPLSTSPVLNGSMLACSDINRFFATPNFIGQQCGYQPASLTVPAFQVRLAVLGGFLFNDDASHISLFEYYSPADLSDYAFDLAYAITNATINPFFGNQDASGYSVSDNGIPTYEASLDIQQAFAFCPQCSIGLYPATALASAFNGILAMNSSVQPHIVSASYAGSENGFNSQAIALIEGILKQLATAGVTSVVSSGDSGANNQANTCSLSTVVATYPGTSRYVLTVGATEYFNGVTAQNDACVFSSTGDMSGSDNYLCGQCNGLSASYYNYCQTRTAGSQRAVKSYYTQDFLVSGFSSGGGFSQVIGQPSAQTRAVAQYLATCGTSVSSCSLPPSSVFNASNRAIPDVSFYGSSTPVGYELAFSFFVGTSVSAPAFAGVLANLLQYYQSATQSTSGLGDVKGLLYGAQQATANSPPPLQAFSDVTVGDNLCLSSRLHPVPMCLSWLLRIQHSPWMGQPQPTYTAHRHHMTRLSRCLPPVMLSASSCVDAV